MIDRSSEHRHIYRPTFNFSPTRNRPVFLIFRRPVNRPTYRLVGPLLKALRYDSYVTLGSHSFTCHPHTNHTCLYSPAARHHHPLAGTNLYCLVNRGTQVRETCPEFLRRVPGRDSNPRPLDRESDTLPTAPHLPSVL